MTTTKTIALKFEDINREGIRETIDALAEALAQHDLILGEDGWHESSAISEVQFDQAFDWVTTRWYQNAGWATQVNSYTLKHICEREIGSGYCSNGAFIAACLFAGLTANIAADALVCTFTGPT